MTGTAEPPRAAPGGPAPATAAGVGPEPTPSAGPTPAAVLLPFHRDRSGALRLVLIERTPYGRHGGQIALPGGKREPVDPTPRDTAVRETCEELGLRPADLEVLGELPAMRTRTTGFLVWPFVARLGRVPDPWRPGEAEVAAVLDLPVAELADPAARDVEEREFAGWRAPARIPVLRAGGHVIWGLTLRILDVAVPRVLAGEYPV